MSSNECSNSVSDIKYESKQIENCLNKGRYYLESHQWEAASIAFEEALLCDTFNMNAYIGRLLAKLQIESINADITIDYDITDLIEYKLAFKYSNTALKCKLEELAKNNRNYLNKKKKKINSIKNAILVSVLLSSFIALLTIFVIIPWFDYNSIKILVENKKLDEAKKQYNENKLYFFTVVTENAFIEQGDKYFASKNYIEAIECYVGFDDEKAFQVACEHYEKETHYTAYSKYFGFEKLLELTAERQKNTYQIAQFLILKNDITKSYEYLKTIREQQEVKELFNTYPFLKFFEILDSEWYSIVPEIHGIPEHEVKDESIYEVYKRGLKIKDGELYTSDDKKILLKGNNLYIGDIKYYKK